MPRNALIAALALPLLVIALGIVRAERQLANSKPWVFDVQGYDPRDLLRGQYINYRLALDEKPAQSKCRDEDEGCCLCLSATSSGEPPSTVRMQCDSTQSRCEGILQTRYLSQLQRYYIPEQRAQKLSERFRDAATAHRARLVVAIDPSGRPQVQALLVDGERIERKSP